MLRTGTLTRRMTMSLNSALEARMDGNQQEAQALALIEIGRELKKIRKNMEDE